MELERAIVIVKNNIKKPTPTKATTNPLIKCTNTLKNS